MDDFHVIYVDRRDLKPTVITDDEGHRRFDWTWFETTFTDRARALGYNYIGFHFDDSDRRRWDLSSNIHGTYRKDPNEVYEFWVACDENMPARSYGTTKYAEFVRLMLHEGAHGFTHFAGCREELMAKFNTKALPERYHLPAHYFDYVVKDIKQIYYHISFEKWSWSAYLVAILGQLVGLLTLQAKQREEQKPPTAPVVDRLRDWALAIQEFEGYLNPKQYPPKGTLSYRQNNPGNLRWSPFEDGNENGFSVFATYEKGLNALIHQLRIAATGESRVYNPEMTLYRFFEVYAPSSDGNYPRNYAEFVARRLGVSPNIIIKNLM